MGNYGACQPEQASPIRVNVNPNVGVPDEQVVFDCLGPCQYSVKRAPS